MSKEELAEESKRSYTFVSPIFCSAAIYGRMSVELDKKEQEISERDPSPDMITICYPH